MFLTTHVTRVCHAELKGLLLTYIPKAKRPGGELMKGRNVHESTSTLKMHRWHSAITWLKNRKTGL